MYELRCESLEKSFGSFALQPLDLAIQPGEFFSLLGPSGCGKTTVLRLLGGFEQPTGGRIMLGDRDITRLQPHKRNIHTVFQRYALFPHLSVFENVAFSLRLKGLAKTEIQRRVDEIMNLTEIGTLADRRIHQLSGGQSQRVALARALVDQPAVLLLDEPFSALDPSLRVRVREEMRTICKKVGATFILVTHDQEEALQLSDRLAVMKDGRCLQVGTPKAIYEDPSDAFVASFIGPVNEIRGELAENKPGEWTVSSAMGTFKVRKNGIALPRDVSMLLRPEKMRLLRQRSNTQENLLEGEIQDLTYLGSRTEYTIKTRDNVFKVSEAELERQKKRLLNRRDRIFLTWKTEDAILLPQSAPK
ncbi:MAG: ABC transporter ATP-binding protein [Proteobacteria bacterium]|nr:ABC transporter ATP-binding protein [Pseudomonadota bacterium]